jgi:C-terminal processing protease CtpA/Prc
MPALGFGGGQGNDDLKTLLTFLHSSGDSSCAASATPLTLWNVVCALVRTCVALSDNHNQVREQTPLTIRLDALTAMTTEISQRMTTVELIMEKMHNASQRQVALAKNYTDVDDRINALRVFVEENVGMVRHDIERLQLGIGKHAEYLNESMEGLSKDVSFHKEEFSRALMKLEDFHAERIAAVPVGNNSSKSLGIAVHLTPTGVEVVAVDPSSTAAACGIAPRDVILAIGQLPVTTVSDISSSMKRLHEEGTSTFDVKVFRAMKIHTVACTLRCP